MYEVSIKFKANNWCFMDKWLDDNIDENAYTIELARHNPRGDMYDMYYFKNDEDVMAFKLMWL